MDSSERISKLQSNLEELRKTYMGLRSKLTAIERRRKKIRRKERERTEKPSGPEVEAAAWAVWQTMLLTEKTLIFCWTFIYSLSKKSLTLRWRYNLKVIASEVVGSVNCWQHLMQMKSTVKIATNDTCDITKQTISGGCSCYYLSAVSNLLTFLCRRRGTVLCWDIMYIMKWW